MGSRSSDGTCRPTPVSPATERAGETGHSPADSDHRRGAFATAAEAGLQIVAPDIAYRRLAIVNVVLLGAPGAGDRGWILVEAGIAGSAGFIARAAAERFGEGARPAAIVMTHGHFDHVGALEKLADCWRPRSAPNPLELPHFDGPRELPSP